MRQIAAGDIVTEKDQTLDRRFKVIAVYGLRAWIHPMGSPGEDFLFGLKYLEREAFEVGKTYIDADNEGWGGHWTYEVLDIRGDNVACWAHHDDKVSHAGTLRADSIKSFKEVVEK